MAGSDVKMFYEDDTFKPDVGKQKTEKLVKKDKVHFVPVIFGATFSGFT
ncbi:MAG: hypothetical protein Ct9H300mP28_30420 [Pseudomonadota bacterium]|nr:MAG: hypothetical protein Ct9H300mP28_30420 [Pseudomonadota bacterium]